MPRPASELFNPYSTYRRDRLIWCIQRRAMKMLNVADASAAHRALWLQWAEGAGILAECQAEADTTENDISLTVDK